MAEKRRNRVYRCTIPVRSRLMWCRKVTGTGPHKKAGPWCLKAGVWDDKCPKLDISYKRM